MKVKAQRNPTSIIMPPIANISFPERECAFLCSKVCIGNNNSSHPYAVNLAAVALIHHLTTEDAEKLLDLRRHNVRSDLHLCALFSESPVLSLFFKALRAQKKPLCSLWLAVFGGGFWYWLKGYMVTACLGIAVGHAIIVNYVLYIRVKGEKGDKLLYQTSSEKLPI
ncbi:MAG TPA: hypothetical protein VEJ88_00525 [Dissulfurispiraceae bacterium]|nr:hypothetical protein [Dissulfurispiraceae bacterium]